MGEREDTSAFGLSDATHSYIDTNQSSKRTRRSKYDRQ